MKIAILGSGVIGTTLAYYLNKAGLSVTVIDRQPASGMETSFANGGQIAAAHADPWAGPATPWKALKWLGQKDAPLLFHYFHPDPKLWSWCLRFLLNCRSSREAINIERTLRVALYSREELKKLRAETGIQYDQREQGIIHFYRNTKEFSLARHAAKMMRLHGLDREEISPDHCLNLEPALADAYPDLVGGIYSENDESGDAHQFTFKLAEICKKRGVEFLYNHNIDSLLVEKGDVIGVKTDHGDILADKIVVCMGSFSAPFLRPLGINLPIYPAKGYSATFELPESGVFPTVSLTDDEFKLVYSRLGNRLRVAGTAELGGYSMKIENGRAEVVARQAQKTFPALKKASSIDLWTGLRPKTPDSVPILGETKFPSLYLNTGHGTLGWTMSCGSSKAMSDFITGQQPKISFNGLTLKRFSKW